MKNTMKTLLTLSLTAVLFFTFSCKPKAEQKKENTTEIHSEHSTHEGHDGMNMDDSGENQGKEYTSKYVCPMHCEGSGSETEGNCPVCGMSYVLNENFKTEEHMNH